MCAYDQIEIIQFGPECQLGNVTITGRGKKESVCLILDDLNLKQLAEVILPGFLIVRLLFSFVINEYSLRYGSFRVTESSNTNRLIPKISVLLVLCIFPSQTSQKTQTPTHTLKLFYHYIVRSIPQGSLSIVFNNFQDSWHFSGHVRAKMSILNIQRSVSLVLSQQAALGWPIFSPGSEQPVNYTASALSLHFFASVAFQKFAFFFLLYGPQNFSSVK